MADTTVGDERLDQSNSTPATSAARTWADSTFVAFRFPVYRIVWTGSILAFLAFNMSSSAQSVVAYDLTGANRAVGVVMFGQGVAMVLLNPIGGAIADRFDKRFLVLLAQTVIGSVILAVGLLLLFDRLTIFWLAVGSFTTGAMFSFLGPTRTSLLADAVSSERVGNAMALLQVGSNVGRIAAPFLAGVLLSLPFLGAGGTYLIIASLFVLVILTMSQIPSSPPHRRSATMLEDVKLGFGYARGHKPLMHAVFGFYAVTALGFSYWVVMPGFAKDELHAGTTGYGVLLGVAAVGGLLGSITVASLADSAKARLYLKLASLLVALALVATGFAPTFVAAAFAMVFVGAGIAAFQTLNNSFALRLSEPAFYGRVAGLLQIAWGMINLLSLPTGFIADATSERAVLVGAGVSLAIVVLLLYLWERVVYQQEAPAAVRHPG